MKDVFDIEIDLLLEGVYQRYGYDFRHYARASLHRRVRNTMGKLHIEKVSEMIPLMLHDEYTFVVFLREMSITVTEMFRDPTFYQGVRDLVIPHLESYPLIKVWHAGCATGEEVYSMAILLKEAGLYQRSHIYATDYNNESLDAAKRGIYNLKLMKLYTENHNNSGPKAAFSDYYHAAYDSAIFAEDLKTRVTFSHHNLVSDGIFGEMNLIVCRNVMIYFDRDLQDRVLTLFRQSLSHRGFLCLGSKESIRHSIVAEDFEVISRRLRIFRKQLSAANKRGLAGGGY